MLTCGWDGIYVICCICRNLRAFLGDQTDPKSAGGGPNSILRTGCVTQLAILPCQCRGVQLHFDLLDNKAFHLFDKIVHQRKVRLQPDCLELDVCERDVPGDARWAFQCLPSHPFSQLFSLEQMEHLKIHTLVYLCSQM